MQSQDPHHQSSHVRPESSRGRRVAVRLWLSRLAVIMLLHGVFLTPVSAQSDGRTGPQAAADTALPRSALTSIETRQGGRPGQTGSVSESAGRPRTPIRRGEVVDEASPSRSERSSIWSTVAILAIVVGGIAAGARFFRHRSLPGIAGRRREIVELITSRRLDGQSSVHVVRIGARILAVGAGPAGMATLTTFDDPREVEQLVGGDGENSSPEARSGLFDGQTSLTTRPMQSTDATVKVVRDRTGAAVGRDSVAQPEVRHV